MYLKEVLKERYNMLKAIRWQRVKEHQELHSGTNIKVAILEDARSVDAALEEAHFCQI